MNNVIISTNIEQTLTEAIARVPHDKLFVLTDEITHRLCLPIIKDLPCMAEAQAIAEIVGQIIHLAAENNIPFDVTSKLGIIVPFRRQIVAVRQALYRQGIKDVDKMMIDTVERYQGSQRDVIIYSFTIQHFYQLEFLTSNCFVEDNQIIDRKLNVALTRARKQMIMTGNPRRLTGNELFKELMEYCKEKGGYYNIE